MAATVAQLDIILAGDNRGAHRALSQTQKDVSALNAAMLAVGVGMTKAFTGGLRSMISLDAQMRNVNSILNVSESTLKGYTATVQDIAMEVGQSTDSVAAALYEIASTGYEGAQALSLLQVSAKAAVAGVTDTQTAVDALTTVLQGFQMEADQAEYVANILFKAVDVGKITFAELNDVIGDVIPRARVLGIELEDLAASYSALTLQGWKPPEISTAMMRFIQGFTKPNPEMKKRMQAAGYESGQDLFGDKGFMGAIDWAISQATDESGKLTVDALNKIFSARGGGDFVLAAYNSDLREHIQLMHEAQGLIDPVTGEYTKLGAMQLALNEQVKSADYHIRRMNVAWNVFTQMMTVALLPVIIKVTDALYLMARFMQDIPQPLQTVIGLLTAFTGALMALHFGARLFGFELGSAGRALLKFVPGLGLALTAVGLLTAAWKINYRGIKDWASELFGTWNKMKNLFASDNPFMDIIGNAESGFQGYAGPGMLKKYADGWDDVGGRIIGTAHAMRYAFREGKGVEQILSIMPKRVRVVARPFVDLADAVGDVWSGFQSGGINRALYVLERRSTRIGRDLQYITRLPIGNAVQGALRVATGMVRAFQEGEKVADILNRMPQRFRGVAEPFLLLADSLGDVWAQIRAGEPLLDAIRAEWGTISGALGDIGRMAIDVVIDIGRFVLGKIPDLYHWVLNTIHSALAGGTAGQATGLSAGVGGDPTVNVGLGTVIVDILSFGAGLIGDVWGAIDGPIQSALDSAGGKAIEVKNLAVTFGEWALSEHEAGTLWSSVKAEVEGFVNTESFNVDLTNWTVTLGAPNEDQIHVDFAEIASAIWKKITDIHQWSHSFEQQDMSSANEWGERIGTKLGYWVARGIELAIGAVIKAISGGGGEGGTLDKAYGPGFARVNERFDGTAMVKTFLDGFFEGFDKGGEQVFEPYKQKVRDWWARQWSGFLDIFATGMGSEGPSQDPASPMYNPGRDFSFMSIVKGILKLDEVVFPDLPDLGAHISGWLNETAAEIEAGFRAQFDHEWMKKLANGDIFGAVKALFGDGGGGGGSSGPSPEDLAGDWGGWTGGIPRPARENEAWDPVSGQNIEFRAPIPDASQFFDEVPVQVEVPITFVPKYEGTGNFRKRGVEGRPDLQSRQWGAGFFDAEQMASAFDPAALGAALASKIDVASMAGVQTAVSQSMGESMSTADFGPVSGALATKVSEAGMSTDWVGPMTGPMLMMMAGAVGAVYSLDWSPVMGAVQASVDGTSGGLLIGNDIGYGMFLGVNAWAGTIANAAASVVSGAIAAARVAADAHSPSRKAMAVTEDIMDGFLLPVLRRKDEVGNALGGLVPDIRPAGYSLRGAQDARQGGRIVTNIFALTPEAIVDLQRKAQKGAAFADTAGGGSRKRLIAAQRD